MRVKNILQTVFFSIPIFLSLHLFLRQNREVVTTVSDVSANRTFDDEIEKLNFTATMKFSFLIYCELSFSREICSEKKLAGTSKLKFYCDSKNYLSLSSIKRSSCQFLIYSKALGVHLELAKSRNLFLNLSYRGNTFFSPFEFPNFSI